MTHCSNPQINIVTRSCRAPKNNCPTSLTLFSKTQSWIPNWTINAIKAEIYIWEAEYVGAREWVWVRPTEDAWFHPALAVWCVETGISNICLEKILGSFTKIIMRLNIVLAYLQQPLGVFPSTFYLSLTVCKVPSATKYKLN